MIIIVSCRSSQHEVLITESRSSPLQLNFYHFAKCEGVKFETFDATPLPFKYCNSHTSKYGIDAFTFQIHFRGTLSR